MMRNKPYVGVTGFTCKSEVLPCLGAVGKNAERLFMVGVLLSSKTINGGTNKYPIRYPHYKSIRDIFVNDENCLNMIHYVTDDKSTLVKQLLDAAEIGGKHCHGFQLNIAWPDIEMLQEVKKELPNHKFVIQCSNSAIKKIVETSPGEDVATFVHSRVQEYQNAGVIDYLLIDPSGGRGVSFDAANTIRLLAPHLSQNDYGVGVAGGLRADTLSRLTPVLTKVPHLFWDAEGGLRDVQDNLMLPSVVNYLAASFDIDALLNAKENFYK